MSAETARALQEAVEAHLLDEAAGAVSMVTHWYVAAAGVDAEGRPMVMSETSQGDDMPRWMTRGLLTDALFEIDRGAGE